LRGFRSFLDNGDRPGLQEEMMDFGFVDCFRCSVCHKNKANRHLAYFSHRSDFAVCKACDKKHIEQKGYAYKDENFGGGWDYDHNFKPDILNGLPVDG